MLEQVRLGASDVRITPIGLGCWAWGDRLVWQYGKGYGENEVREAFRVSVDAGINWFDTAEVYGFGQSELLLGRFIRESGKQLIVATKFFPMPWRLRSKDVVGALRKSLYRLQMKQVDLYQLHSPASIIPVETWMKGLADAVEAGLTRAVGVSNYDLAHTERAVEALGRRGIPLASNQIEYSLLHRSPEKRLIPFCREHNITIIAYSPIAKGILTGKYTPEKLPPGVRARTYNRQYLTRVQPLISLLRELGEAHGKTPAPVALNWCICKGTVAIPGAKNARQASENAGALGWRLSSDEVQRLDEVSEKVG